MKGNDKFMDPVYGPLFIIIIILFLFFAKKTKFRLGISYQLFHFVITNNILSLPKENNNNVCSFITGILLL